MRFTHHIWDFDGTIADTYPHTARAFREAMRRLGRDPLPPYEEVFLHLQVTWIHARDYFAMTEEEYAAAIEALDLAHEKTAEERFLSAKLKLTAQKNAETK